MPVSDVPDALAKAVLLAALVAAAPAAAQTSDLVTRTSLRVCADPANMPFSNKEGQGFENKLADLLAKDLNIPVEYTWFPQATGFVRNTLGAKTCDVVMGYAAGTDPVQNSNPYYKSSWVLVYRVLSEGGLDGIETLSDERLKTKRLGVIAGSPPATLLVEHGLIAQARPYPLMVDRRFESPAEKMLTDLVNGEIDGGLLWGPIAGYYVKRTRTPMAIVPLVKEKSETPMAFRITFGIRHGELEWKHQLNDFITKRQPEINKILLDFGVPLLDEQDRPITVP